MFLFCLVFAMFCARLFICASWSPAGKGLTFEISSTVIESCNGFGIYLKSLALTVCGSIVCVMTF